MGHTVKLAVALVALLPGAAQAVVPPVTCGDANGDQYYDYRRLTDDLVVTTMWSVAGIGTDFHQVRLVSCSAMADVRVTIPYGGYGITSGDVVERMAGMVASNHTYSFAQVADIFAAAGEQSEVVQSPTPSCICQFDGATM